jgi:hypothetical protein
MKRQIAALAVGEGLAFAAAANNIPKKSSRSTASRVLVLYPT